MGEGAAVESERKAVHARRDGRMPADRRLGQLTPREVGMLGEDIACGYLERHGLTVVSRNWRCEYGEADVVCSPDHETVVLVEVKTRVRVGGSSADMPETAVGPSKRKRYRGIALRYLWGHPSVCSVRFDVVAIVVTGQHSAHVRHIVNAFVWDD